MSNSGVTTYRVENAHVPLDELGRRLTRVLDLFKTRKQAAEVAERSVDMLAKYEKGAVEPPFSGLARLCLAAGVRMEWLATGEEPMLALHEYAGVREPEPPPYMAGAPEPGGAMDREMDLLTDAVRITEDVLHKFGIRQRANAAQFAELVRFMYGELAAGAAEDAASAALERILDIARTPR